MLRDEVMIYSSMTLSVQEYWIAETTEKSFCSEKAWPLLTELLVFKYIWFEKKKRALLVKEKKKTAEETSGTLSIRSEARAVGTKQFTVWCGQLCSRSLPRINCDAKAAALSNKANYLYCQEKINNKNKKQQQTTNTTCGRKTREP